VSGRTVDVAPERLAGWLDRFAQSHGELNWTRTEDRLIAVAPDGARADCEVPFPPLEAGVELPAGVELAQHALRERRVGVLLVRLGGYAAGVFEGPTLVASKVGSRYVHGRNAAGGQSQQRFARRRDGQVRVALQEATDVAVRVLGPVAATLDAVVLGGDRQAVTTVVADPRLSAVRALAVGRVLDVPDPRLRVLQSTPAMFGAVRITVTDP